MDFTHPRGTTFFERGFNITVNGTPITIEAVTMALRRDYGAPVAYEVQTEITGAGAFVLSEQVINIPALEYVYDIRIVYDGGTVKNWVSGKFIITDNVTRS